MKTYPLSHPQKGVWNVEKIHKGTCINNIAGTLRMSGDIDFKLMERAINLVIEKNDALRLRFVEINGEPRQYVSKYEYVNIDYFDFSKKDIKELYQWDEQQTKQPFNLEKGPLFYFAILKIKDGESGFYIKYHHLISDAWSIIFTANKIIEYYFFLKNGSPISEQKYSYIDFINSEQEYKSSKRYMNDREFWHGMFNDLPEKTVLKSKKINLSNTSAGRKSFVLPDKLCKKIKEHCMETKSTIFGIFLASLAMYINRTTNKRDIVIGIPVLNRRNAAEKNTAGMFVSTVPFRIIIENNLSYKEFSEKITGKWLSVLRHQRYPYDILLEELHEKHNFTENLYDIVLSYQNAKLIGGNTGMEFQRMARWHFNGSQIESLSIHINDREDDGNIILNFDYLKDLFYEKEIEFIYDHLIRLLWHALDNPSREIYRIHMVSEKERHRILHEFNDTKQDYPKSKTINQLFKEQVRLTPDKPALIFEEEKMTYAELNKKSNQLARLLREKGVKQDSLVGLMFERSFNMIIGILAVLKAGGAYLPIDPEYPDERVNFMLKDSKAEILLTQDKLAGKASFDGDTVKFEDVEIHRYEDADLDIINKPDDLAYVIYTSGSTGTPKGVMIEHKGIINLQQVFKNRLGITEEDRVVQFSSISFDASVWEIFMALLVGATLAIPTKNIIENFEKFENYINETRITVATLPPTYLAHLNPANIVTLKMLISAGSAIPVELYKKWRDKVIFVNAYGPTENTICSTLWIDGESSISDNSVPIGKPLYNMKAYILNENKMIQPIGIPGELYMSGVGLARGYLNRDDLTKQNFIDNPYVKGEKMYKTGDLARWYPNGDIKFLGRIDNQIKIRGYRIELGEIENILASHPLIKEAVVTTVTDAGGDNSLCAYYIPIGDLEKSELVSFLIKRLPHYMVPSYFIKMEKFPLTTSGKVDRKSLPKPEIGAKTTEYTAPANEVEKKLTELWSEILDIDTDNLGTNCTLLDLGADSLDIIKFITQLHKYFDVQLSMSELFELQTIQATGKYIMKQKKEEYMQIKKQPEGQEYYPVSAAQKRLYLLSNRDNSGLTYNMPGVMLIEGKIDRGRFENALKELINRHESLRTSFKIINGQPVQIVHGSVDFELDYREAQEQQIHGIIKHFFTPFQLEKAPLLKVGLIKINEEKYLLLFDMHHIISDGESTRILLNELASLYAGQNLPPLEIQYKDYAAWHNGLLCSDRMKKMEKYWMDLFSDNIPVLNMPTDFPRPPVQSFEGERISFKLNKPLTQKLKKISNDNNVTLYMTLLAAYYILLSKYSAQEDIVVGTPVDGRLHADLRGIIGMFVNTLPLRNYPEGSKTFKQFLSEVRESSINAFENRDYPFEEMVRKLVTTRDPSRNPLFDTMFVMQKYDFTEINLGGMKFNPYKFDFNISKFDVTLEAFEQSDGIAFNFEYCTRLYRENTIKRMAEHYINILTAVAQNIDIVLSEIDMLSEKEKKQLLYDFNNTKADYPGDKTIHQLFEEQVERTPDKTALVFEGKEMTYSELNKKANQLAAVLRRKGVKPDTIVGLMFERSFEMIIGILGILKAGGAYLPIDPDYPPERVEYMLKDSNASILLTQEDIASKMKYNGEIICLDSYRLDTEDCNNLPYINTSGDMAYLIYTSGSTGNPKGVIVEHKGVANLMILFKNRIGVRQEDRIIQFASISFDASVFEIFMALLLGATLFILSKKTIQNFREFENYLNRNGITIATLPPTYIENLIPENIHTLKKLVAAGSVSMKNLYDRWKNKVQYINGYGPTEATVCTTTYIGNGEIKRGRTVPIGIPVFNTKVYILNEYMKLNPIGVPGELCISGVGLARGYLNKPGATSESFVESPFEKGEKLYKTGDIAVWHDDGNIEFLERKDYQVKIRGIRIELSEIEKCMLEIDKVEEAVVIDKCDASGKAYLCAYYTSGRYIDISVFKDRLAEKLPRYMIPSYFIRVDNIPLTPNGKVDRNRLPEPTANITSETEYIPPDGDTEEKLVKVWQEVLGLQEVSTNSDFFDIGGDSLAIMQVLTATSKYQWNLEFNDFYELRTIKNIAMKIDTETVLELPEICPTDIESVDIKEEATSIQIIPEKLNNVLLTGATGYLGTHILKYLLSRPNTNIYCMVRNKNNTPSIDRLIEKMQFYFNEDYRHLINKRIFIINGDITLDKFGMEEKVYNYIGRTVDTVIHAAAKVLHYGNYGEFNEVNVDGTRRIVKFSLENNIELKHISTLSIFGNFLTNSEMKGKQYNEYDFFVNQDYNENVYVRTKFEAENIVLKAMKEGLNATILRLGNLTGRYDDGHFQDNISENYFYSAIRSVVKLGVIPRNLLNMEIDFTPVDYASKAVVMISETEESNGRIFHIFNHNSLKANEILRMFAEIGINNIKALAYDEFKRYINDISRDGKRKLLLLGFINEITSNEEVIYDDSISIDSEITQRFLLKLGFEWPIIDREYIKKLVKYMQEVNFI